MNREIIVPIAKAQELGETFGFTEAVAMAKTRGWDAVRIEAIRKDDGTYDVRMSEPEGVMIALMLDAEVAQKVAMPGGEPSEGLHISLAYLGDAKDLTLEQQRTLVKTVGDTCREFGTLEGVLKGTGRFDTEEEDVPFWVGAEIPGLTELRDALQANLTKAGINSIPSETPHVTVAYIAKDATPAVEFAPVAVTFKSVTIAVGGQHLEATLKEAPAEEGWIPAAINKSLDTNEEERYTLGPFYIPNRLDAHNEWSDPANVQKAFRGYLAKDNTTIWRQHKPGTAAGERVDGVVWPYELTVPLVKADGTQTMHTFPAGTPFLGVHWTEEAWADVKAGKIRGYSMGGTASMVEVDLGDA